MSNKNEFRIITAVKNKKIIISVLILLGVLILNCWFLVVRGAAYVDSDMASNFIAGVVNNSEKVLLSRNWYYSTGVPFLSDTNMFQFVLLFIKGNWVLARAVAIMILQLLLVGSFYALSRYIGFERSMSILFSAFCLAPASYWMLLMISFGGYYLSGTILGVISLLVSLWYANISDNKKSLYICISIMVIDGLITGINGIKGVIFPYGPMALTAVAILFFSVREKKEKINDFKAKEWRYFTGIVIGCVSFAVGFLINMTVIASKFHFENKDSMSWAPLDLKGFIDGFSECISILGYQSDSHVNWLSNERTVRSVFSLQGIANLFGIAMICFFVFSVVRLTLRYKKLNFMEKAILITFYSSVFVGCLIFKFTEGYDTSAVYWVPVYPLMLLVMMIEIKTEDFVFEISSALITVIFSVCIVITSFSTLKLYQESPLYANPQLVNVVDWLEEQGYTQGYATFWQSNSVTFLSDGKIDMWNVYGFDNLEPQHWLQKMSHDAPPEGERIFALIGPNDELDRENFLQYMNIAPGLPEIVYQDEEGYIVVEYK